MALAHNFSIYLFISQEFFIFSCSVFPSSITKPFQAILTSVPNTHLKSFVHAQINSYRCPTEYPTFWTPRPLPDHQDHVSLIRNHTMVNLHKAMSTHLSTIFPWYSPLLVDLIHLAASSSTESSRASSPLSLYSSSFPSQCH